MERRAFFLTPLVALLPSVPEAKGLPPREFWRYIRPLDKWVKITRYEIKPNDILRVFDPPDGFDLIVRVTRVEEDQFWSDMEIDPKTNQWIVYAND